MNGLRERWRKKRKEKSRENLNSSDEVAHNYRDEIEYCYETLSSSEKIQPFKKIFNLQDYPHIWNNLCYSTCTELNFCCLWKKFHNHIQMYMNKSLGSITWPTQYIKLTTTNISSLMSMYILFYTCSVT